MNQPDYDFTESYNLSWYIPDRVILLTIMGDYSAADAKAVNDSINEVLDNSPTPLLLLIDASQMDRPFNFQRIRALQSYMNHDHLKHIFVVASDKLVGLAMMVIFNMGRAYLHMYDTHDQAAKNLEYYANHI